LVNLGERVADERTGYRKLSESKPHGTLFRKSVEWDWDQARVATSRYTSPQTSEQGWRRAFDSPHRPLFTLSRL